MPRRPSPRAVTGIVKRNQLHSFVVLPKRGIIEGTIAWLNRCRKFAKDRECLNRKALASLRLTSIRPDVSGQTIRHIFTKPYTPKTNGKAERFIQTSLRERAYARAYHSSKQRAAELPYWMHRYNWHRPHGSIGAAPLSADSA